MFARLASVAVVAMLSLSPPQSQSDEIAALKREIQTLKAQQASMQRDLDMIKSLLQSLVQARGQQPEEAFTDKLINITDAPTKGNPSAKVTLVEVSDYHCPYLPAPESANDATTDGGLREHGKSEIRVPRLSDRAAAPGRVSLA